MTAPVGTLIPGTWRVSDGSAVAFAVAKEAWSLAAREILVRTARSYHAYITYGELAEEVQQVTGIRTRSQMRNWIGAVLGKVADDCRLRCEPSLTALCVHQDETVGEGYAYVLKIAGEEIPDDLDFHAAEARFACYRAFGAELPSDGGQPALTAKVAAARKHKAKQIEVMPALCPQCFIQLPVSGRCDNCD
ncbi:MAG: hypothetical protein ABI903_18225 [Actinomycetota bacterium]